MSIELSTPVKIVALAGLALVAGAAGALVLMQHHSNTTPVVAPRTQTHVRPAARTHSTPARPTAPQLVSGLPAPLIPALSHSKVVVAVVWAQGDPVAAGVLAEARRGARLAQAPFVVLNVAGDKVAAQTAAWMGGRVVEPAVLVVTRPGTIAAELDGDADQLAVAQAVVNSRS